MYNTGPGAKIYARLTQSNWHRCSISGYTAITLNETSCLFSVKSWLGLNHMPCALLLVFEKCGMNFLKILSLTDHAMDTCAMKTIQKLIIMHQFYY